MHREASGWESFCSAVILAWTMSQGRCVGKFQAVNSTYVGVGSDVYRSNSDDDVEECVYSIMSIPTLY
jgi:hypothetical protein